MKKKLLPTALAVAVSFCFASFSSTLLAQADDRADVSIATKVEFLGTAVPTRFTVDARRLPVLDAWKPGDPIFDIPRQHWLAANQKPPATPIPVNAFDPIDPLMGKANNLIGTRAQRAFGTPLINVAGIANTGVSPPDTSSDVGKNHIIQSINGSAGARYVILNKLDGTVAAGPFSMAALGSGGACATSLGDPHIMYDEMAERWVITEFSNQTGRSLCMYVSSGSDPVTTTWSRYAFLMPAFPDYPHYGVWSHSYLATANEGGTSGQRPVYAMERAAMLAGQPARFVRATLPNLAGFGFQTWTPADHDGKNNPVPATLPGIFMRHRDDEAHNAGANNGTRDFLELAELTVDWTPTTPTGTLSPIQQIQIAEFSSDLNGLSAFNAFPQPSGQKLDPLREPIMTRVAYRRFPGYESLVGNLVTDVDGQDTGGIRWFELRRATGGAWALYQEGTHALADAGGPADRWMAGSAMDQDGNIALSYSVTRQSPAIFPGLRYVGRLAGDPLGAMTTTENTIIDGAGSQGGERWGDYQQLTVDPEDGCTFVATGEYIPTGTSWQTRVASFKFDECGGPSFGVNVSNTATQPICAAALPVSARPVTLNYNSFNGFSSPVNVSFTNAPIPGVSGSFSAPSVTPPGSLTANVQLTSGVTAGIKTLQISSVSGAITRTNSINLDVYTQAVAAPTLNAPANAATNVVTAPTLSWTPSPQSLDYVVQIFTNSALPEDSIVAQTITTGTSWTPPALSTATTYFWRVIARNPCAQPSIDIYNNGFEDASSQASSPIFSFRTLLGPGDCPVGSPTVLFSENMETGATGWVNNNATIWSISNAFPASGARAYRGVAPDVTSTSQLDSPSITLPAATGLSSLSLVFQNRASLEANGTTACYDGGQLQISTDGGTTYTTITAGITGYPYTGNTSGLSGTPGWCGSSVYRLTGVSLLPYAGQTVKFRFRLGSDVNTNVPEGWNIDDVKVQSCPN